MLRVWATTWQNSVALPMTLAVAAEHGHIQAGDHVGMFGIGSGINCLMLGCRWNKTLVGRREENSTVGSQPAQAPADILDAR